MVGENRVVITGLGAVTPIGVGAPVFWEALKGGVNGVGKIQAFDVTAFRSKVAAEIHDFDPEQWIDRKAARRMDRFTHFGMAASALALADAGLADGGFDGYRAGVFIGSGIGGSQTIQQGAQQLRLKGPGGIDPFFISKLLVNMAASMVSITYGLKGPLSAPSMACSSGATSIGNAFRVLQRGEADVMLAGGTEACIDPLAYAGFCASRSMTANDDPETASRPFDKNRDGFVMGEGAGIVILETLDHALSRGARVYAELAGYGCTADAYHFTAPHPEAEGMARVMQLALSDANLNPSDIGHINAHGTSTPLNDQCESTAIQKVFGDHAVMLKVSSNKSMMGHLLGAAGAVECIATALSLYYGMVPPTIHCVEPDPLCPLNYVTDGAVSIPLQAAISNAFGFGGGNACLALRRYA